MSARVLVIVTIFVAMLGWTLRRPFVGVCVVVALFHLNLRVLGTGLEDIRFQFYATLVLMISYFINQETLNRIPSPTYPPMRWLIAFTSMTFITSAWAVDSGHAFESAFEFSKIIVFSWFMSKIIKTEKELRILLYVIFAGCWYTSFMAQWGVEWNIIDEVEIGVATGGSGTHLMMFLPLMILMVIYGNWKEKLYAGAIIPFVLNFLPNTESGSRSTFLTLITVSVMLLLFLPGRMRLKALPPMIIGGLLFIFVLTPPGYFEYMMTILDPSSESSAASRALINEASFKIIQEYPLGIGYDNYPIVSMKYLPDEALTDLGTRDAHNSFLKITCEFGIIGFIFWVMTALMTWRFFRKVRRTLKSGGARPTTLQLSAMSFEIGLISIFPGLWTHNYNQLDSLYWMVALSGVLYTLQQRQTPEAEPAQSTKPPLPAKAPGVLPPPKKPAIKAATV